MTLKQLATKAKHTAQSHSPTILTTCAVAGMVGTVYLAGRASWTSAEQVMYEEMDEGHLDAKARVKLVWKNYIPTGVVGTFTAGCIIGAQRAGFKKTAAAQAAFVATERAFSDYRDKVAETVGKGQEQKVRDAIKQDQVDANPPMVIAGEGALCMESHTGRYFRCDIETLRKACNEVNAKMLGGLYSTLDDLYELIGLEYTDESSRLGWEADRLMELQFSSALYDGKPVLVFSYNYLKAV